MINKDLLEGFFYTQVLYVFIQIYPYIFFTTGKVILMDMVQSTWQSAISSAEVANIGVIMLQNFHVDNDLPSFFCSNLMF